MSNAIGAETAYHLDCHNHNPILSSFTTYYRVCHKSNTTGATSGEETVYPLVCRNTNPILSSFTTYYRVCHKSKVEKHMTL